MKEKRIEERNAGDEENSRQHMPADQRHNLEQSEQQLVLLEDEVFDFDDVQQQQQQPEEQQPEQQPHKKQKRDSALVSPAACQEAQETREMIASMLDQQPLMSVDTTPSAYLEYLRIIFSCARLLRQPAMPQDLRQSVTSLLAKAKSLFCANAFSLVVQTVNAVGSGGGGVVGNGRQPPPVPAFWRQTFSQHECALWTELIETVFYFWAEPDPAGVRDAIVEAFAVGLLERLGGLREDYRPSDWRGGEAASTDAAAAAAAAAEAAQARVERLALEARRSLRPRHLLALTSVKKADKALAPTLAVFGCFLEAAGALPEAAPASPSSKTPLGRTKAALDGVTFEQVRAALRLHRPGQFADCLGRLQRLRRHHLCRPELQRPRDHLGPARDPGLADFLAAYAEYALAASDFELAWQRAAVQDDAAMAPFLLGRLSRVVASNIARAKATGCWEALAEPLQLEMERQSARRLSSLTTVETTVDGDGRNGGIESVTFELHLVPRGDPATQFRPEFVLPSDEPGDSNGLPMS